MSWFEHGTTRIYYEEEGGGDPLLLIPGWGGSIQELGPIRQALTRRHRVIAADPPGSGQSKPQPREFPISYYTDDSLSFLALLDALRASPAHLVGFSDGGEYALLMAQLKPAAVRSIVTWGSAGQVVAPPGMLEAFSQVIDNPIPPLQEFSHYMKSTYGEDNARVMVQSQAKVFRAMIDAGGDISRKRAGDIACPAILITGEKDFIAPPSLVSEMADAMQNAAFVEAEGAGHGVHHASPDWLATTIVDWLAKH